MKPRDLWLLPAAVFPYWVLVAVRLMRKGVFGVLYENAAPPVLISAAAVALAAILGSLVWIVLCVRRGSSARDMLKTMLRVKCAQIPAYLLYFQASVIFPFSIMTIPISVFYIPICLLAVFLTGIGLCAAVVRCRKEGRIGIGTAIGCFLGSYVPVCSLLICAALRRMATASPSDTASSASE